MTSKLVLLGGSVLTLGSKTPNFTTADVLIEEGKVSEVGPGIRARDAEQVDAADTIVMPGFVDTHRHGWRSLLRNLGDASPTVLQDIPARDRYGPDDVYAGTLVGLLGAVEAGITTVVDWADIPPGDGLLEAALQAHADAGLRTVFVHVPHPTDDHQGSDAILRRVAARAAEVAGPATTIAYGSSALGPPDGDRLDTAWTTAREQGLQIHAHADGRTARAGEIATAARRGLLGSDVTLVHHTELDGADLDAIGSSGVSVSLAPSSEMAGGMGAPPIQELIDRGIRPGLGVGDERVAPGDMFAQMRATISLQHATMFERKLAGKAALPRLMSTRDVIRYATAEGARVAGLGGVTGSLEPGKQADVVVLRTDRPNIFPINDPIGAVVWGMDTSNVDWVIAAGRVLVRGGELQTDARRVRNLAMEARERISAAVGPVADVAPGAEA